MMMASPADALRVVRYQYRLNLIQRGFRGHVRTTDECRGCEQMTRRGQEQRVALQPTIPHLTRSSLHR